MALKRGQEVTIRHGSCTVPVDASNPDGPEKTIDVTGLQGTVDEPEPYESASNGKGHVVIQASEECGGGLASVPVDRISTGSPKSFGWDPAFAEGHERIFGRRSRRRRSGDDDS